MTFLIDGYEGGLAKQIDLKDFPKTPNHVMYIKEETAFT